MVSLPLLSVVLIVLSSNVRFPVYMKSRTRTACTHSPLSLKRVLCQGWCGGVYSSGCTYPTLTLPVFPSNVQALPFPAGCACVQRCERRVHGMFRLLPQLHTKRCSMQRLRKGEMQFAIAAPIAANHQWFTDARSVWRSDSIDRLQLATWHVIQLPNARCYNQPECNACGVVVLL